MYASFEDLDMTKVIREVKPTLKYLKKHKFIEKTVNCEPTTVNGYSSVNHTDAQSGAQS